MITINSKKYTADYFVFQNDKFVLLEDNGDIEEAKFLECTIFPIGLLPIMLRNSNGANITNWKITDFISSKDSAIFNLTVQGEMKDIISYIQGYALKCYEEAKDERLKDGDGLEMSYDEYMEDNVDDVIDDIVQTKEFHEIIKKELI